MKEVFLHFFSAGLSGSVLILAVIAARLLLRKVPKRDICLLWLLVGLRLLIPFTIESNLSLQPNKSAVVKPDTEVIIGQQPSAPAPVIPDSTQTPVTSVPSTEGVPGTAAQGSTTTPIVVAKADYAAIAAWVWLAGAGGMLAYALVSYHMLKHKLRGAVPLQQGVFEDPAVRSPFLLGYFRPGIYLPCNVPQEHRGHILAHEHCHIRRGDNWVKLIGFICLSIHWYNPLAWLAYSLLCKDMEMACDEAVIRSMDMPQRKAYSAALLSCAVHRQNISACPVAFGEDNVKQRIVKVLHYRKPTLWLTVVAVLTVIVLAVCFLTNPAVQADPTEPQELDPVEKCRQAVARLQSADSYAISETRKLHTTDDCWYAWDTSFHLRSGDNWYHRFETSDWTWEYFAYNGRRFAKDTTNAVPEEDIPHPEWTETDLSNEPFLQNSCWILNYEWDADATTLKQTSTAGTTITLSVEPQETDVLSEELQFYIDDQTGKLGSVSRMQQRTNGVSFSTVYIHYNDETDIAATLSEYYRNILAGNGENAIPSGTVFAAMLTRPDDWAYEAYKTFFYSHFGNGDKVIFADVTHDGEAEMLVVHPYSNGDFCYGFVFTIDTTGVRLIYSNYGGADHTSGFYGWYLRPADKGYNLAEETFGMYCGIGTLTFEEYYLRLDGQRISVDRIYVSSDDPESRDEVGAGSVSSEAADRYEQQLNERISKFYLIYRTATQSTVDCLQLDDALWQLFQ